MNELLLRKVAFRELCETTSTWNRRLGEGHRLPRWKRDV